MYFATRMYVALPPRGEMAWVRRADGSSAVNYVLLCALLCGLGVPIWAVLESSLADEENGLGAYFFCHLRHIGDRDTAGGTCGAAGGDADDLFDVGPDDLASEAPDRAALDLDTEWHAYEHAFRLHALATGVDVPTDPTQLSLLVEAFRDSGGVTMYPLGAEPPKSADQKCRELVSRGVLACVERDARFVSALQPGSLSAGGIQPAVLTAQDFGRVHLVADGDETAQREDTSPLRPEVRSESRGNVMPSEGGSGSRPRSSVPLVSRDDVPDTTSGSEPTGEESRGKPVSAARDAERKQWVGHGRAVGASQVDEVRTWIPHTGPQVGDTQLHGATTVNIHETRKPNGERCIQLHEVSVTGAAFRQVCPDDGVYRVGGHAVAFHRETSDGSWIDYDMREVGRAADWLRTQHRTPVLSDLWHNTVGRLSGSEQTSYVGDGVYSVEGHERPPQYHAAGFPQTRFDSVDAARTWAAEHVAQQEVSLRGVRQFVYREERVEDDGDVVEVLLRRDGDGPWIQEVWRNGELVPDEFEPELRIPHEEMERLVGHDRLVVNEDRTASMDCTRLESGAVACSPRLVCFAAGTPVVTESGLRPIETIREGDVVLAGDEASGARGWRRVVRRFVTPKQPLWRLVLRRRVDDAWATETIEATPEHPFFVRGVGWRAVRTLSRGDRLIASHGELIVLDNAETGRSDTVFNFEVEGLHTYFVGESEAWVHNECEPEDAYEEEVHGHYAFVLGPDGRPMPWKLITPKDQVSGTTFLSTGAWEGVPLDRGEILQHTVISDGTTRLGLYLFPPKDGSGEGVATLDEEALEDAASEYFRTDYLGYLFLEPRGPPPPFEPYVVRSRGISELVYDKPEARPVADDAGKMNDWITLRTMPSVFSAGISNSPRMMPILRDLVRRGKFRVGAHVADMGAGNGPIGVYLARAFSTVEVIHMIDRDPIATELAVENAGLRGNLLSGVRVIGTTSYVFRSHEFRPFNWRSLLTSSFWKSWSMDKFWFASPPEPLQYDTVVANLPVLWGGDEESFLSSFANAMQANRGGGEFGRKVLEEFLTTVKRHLKPARIVEGQLVPPGNALFNHFGAQDWGQTEELLNEHFGEEGDGWEVVHDEWIPIRHDESYDALRQMIEKAIEGSSEDADERRLFRWNSEEMRWEVRWKLVVVRNDEVIADAGAE